MGRKKCEYCIDFRDMHTAIHGLIVFNSRKEAETAYLNYKKRTDALERDRLQGKIDAEDANCIYQSLTENLFNHAVNVYEEINFREIKEEMSTKYLKYYKVKSCIIINMMSLDIYM